MLKRPITYTDFNGKTVTEDFYFNISMSELMDMELNSEGGVEEYFKNLIAKAEKGEKGPVIREFRKIILSAYGVKSEDGKRFVKNDEFRDDFASSAAFDALFIDMATNEKAAENFFMGALPKELTDKLGTPTVQDKPKGPPPVPRTRRTNG